MKILDAVGVKYAIKMGEGIAGTLDVELKREKGSPTTKWSSLYDIDNKLKAMKKGDSVTFKRMPQHTLSGLQNGVGSRAYALLGEGNYLTKQLKDEDAVLIMRLHVGVVDDGSYSGQLFN